MRIQRRLLTPTLALALGASFLGSAEALAHPPRQERLGKPPKSSDARGKRAPRVVDTARRRPLLKPHLARRLSIERIVHRQGQYFSEEGGHLISHRLATRTHYPFFRRTLGAVVDEVMERASPEFRKKANASERVQLEDLHAMVKTRATSYVDVTKVGGAIDAIVPTDAPYRAKGLYAERLPNGTLQWRTTKGNFPLAFGLGAQIQNGSIRLPRPPGQLLSAATRLIRSDPNAVLADGPRGPGTGFHETIVRLPSAGTGADLEQPYLRLVTFQGAYDRIELLDGPLAKARARELADASRRP